MMARVLLADDEPAMRRRVKTILADLGCDVTEAEDGQKAIDALAGGPFDLVVTDLRMPEVDGLGVLREVRARFKHVPVIVVTASGRVTDAVAAMKGGAWSAISLRSIVTNRYTACVVEPSWLDRPPPRIAW